MRKVSLFIGLLCSVCLFAADECRYQSVEGQYGTTLLNSLHKIIFPHTKFAYADVRADKAGVDIVNQKVVDIYSNCSFSTRGYCSGLDDFEACECYNREHLLPKSWWESTYEKSNDTTYMYTDLFNVVPADYEANNNRSAWIYDEVSGPPTWTNGVSKLGKSANFTISQNEYVFEPADEYKGDIARTYFYMITCYNYRSFTVGGKGYRYFINGTTQLNSTALDLLLRWHRNDPVSDKEKKRNDAVEKKQGNRNPFIDAPSLVEYVWGNKSTAQTSAGGYKCTTTDLKETPAVTIDINNPRCRVFNVTGQEVTASKTHLSQGIYILYLNGQTQTILLH